MTNPDPNEGALSRLEEFSRAVGWQLNKSVTVNGRSVTGADLRHALDTIKQLTARAERAEAERDIALRLHQDALRLAGADVTEAYEIGRGLRPSPFESGWLIEAWNSKTGELLAKWFNLSGFLDGVWPEWTADTTIALRFARECDAQAYIDETGWTEAKPIEHGWGKPVAAPNPPTPSERREPALEIALAHEAKWLKRAEKHARKDGRRSDCQVRDIERAAICKAIAEDIRALPKADAIIFADGREGA